MNKEFKDRRDLEKYTRSFISSHFDIEVRNGDVVPKDYKFKKISDLNDTELYSVLTYYRNKHKAEPSTKTQIVTIKDYYDAGKLTMHHTFDYGDNTDMYFWIFMFIVIIILIIIYYRRK